MAIFLNVHFVKRNYECTNIVAAVTNNEAKPTHFYSGQPCQPSDWKPGTQADILALDLIGAIGLCEDRVSFYGHL